MEQDTTAELIRKEKQEYFKNWRKKNKDKVKKYNDKYWKKRIEKKENNQLK